MGCRGEAPGFCIQAPRGPCVLAPLSRQARDPLVAGARPLCIRTCQVLSGLSSLLRQPLGARGCEVLVKVKQSFAFAAPPTPPPLLLGSRESGSLSEPAKPVTRCGLGRTPPSASFPSCKMGEQHALQGLW